MKPFLHLLLLAASGLEIVGTSLESLSLSASQQHALVALLAVYIPLSHYVLSKAVK